MTCRAPTNPQVTLRDGADWCIWGKNLHSRKGHVFCAFQGIPYAKPPIGELRFKPPQALGPWKGLTLNCCSEAPKCMQFDFLSLQLEGQEDCLYLNVYTPSVCYDGHALPVMVWIHGGGLAAGSGNTDLYGPELLLDHGVVLVTINYRLGVFGFLALDSPECPGNLGFKDQVAALTWVRDNISKFGGNPDNVTIFGESAGAACVQHLMFSPLARGLFHRAIAQSGAALCDWALERVPLAKSTLLARRLGCEATAPGEILQFLRTVDAEKLVKAEFQLRVEEGRGVLFSAVMEPAGTEGAFLTEDPRELLAKGDVADVPLMTGCTTDEGLWSLGKLQSQKADVSAVLQRMLSLSVPHELALSKDSTQHVEVAGIIQEFYQKLVPGNVEGQYVALMSDSYFTKGMDETIRGHSVLGRSPVYLYQFSYDGSLGLFKKRFGMKNDGTAHADELGYLFQAHHDPSALKGASEADLQTIDRVLKLWTNFAKTGNPTPDDDLEVKWEPVQVLATGSDVVATRYLDIGGDLVMHQGSLLEHRARFWRQLVHRFRNS